MKKVVALMAAGALSLCMAGCASGASTEPTKSQEPVQEQKAPEKEAAKAFDGSAFTDTGAGVIYLSTAGGTSEGGKVPEIAVAKDTQLMQIGINTNGMDGSVCTVYVDGAENTTLNAGDRTQQSITLQGDMLKQGSHIVELVKMNGTNPAIYKKAEFKVA